MASIDRERWWQRQLDAANAEIARLKAESRASRQLLEERSGQIAALRTERDEAEARAFKWKRLLLADPAPAPADNDIAGREPATVINMRNWVLKEFVTRAAECVELGIPFPQLAEFATCAIEAGDCDYDPHAEAEKFLAELAEQEKRGE